MNFNTIFQQILMFLQERNYPFAYTSFLALQQTSEFQTKLPNFVCLESLLLRLSDADQSLTGASSDALENEQALLKDFHDQLIVIQHLTSEEINFLNTTVALSSTIQQLTKNEQASLVADEALPILRKHLVDISTSLDQALDCCLNEQSPASSLITARKIYIAAEQHRQLYNIHSGEKWHNSIIEQCLEVISTINQVALDKTRSAFLHFFLDETKFFIEIYKLNHHPSGENLSSDMVSHMAQLIKLYSSHAISEACTGKKASSVRLMDDANQYLAYIKAANSDHLLNGQIESLTGYLKETNTSLATIPQIDTAPRTGTLAIFATQQATLLASESYIAYMQEYLLAKNYSSARSEFNEIRQFHLVKFFENIEHFIVFTQDDFLQKSLYYLHHPV